VVHVTGLHNPALQDTLVRMIVPMRREFGRAIEISQMLREPRYAQAVIAEAMTSREERLRNYAALAERYLRAAEKAPQTPAPGTAAPSSTAALARDAAQAARYLIDLIGPAGESLAIRIERAKDDKTLRDLVAYARDHIAASRGNASAAEFMQRVGAVVEAPRQDAPRPQQDQRADEPTLKCLLREAHDDIAALRGEPAADAALEHAGAR
jgi:hypothetical protein